MTRQDTYTTNRCPNRSGMTGARSGMTGAKSGMTAWFVLVVIAGLAGTLLAGCSKTAQPAASKVPVASETPIVFSNPVPQTKGAPQLISLERLAAQRFGVSAWYTPDNETFNASSQCYIFNHRFGTLSAGPDYSTAIWQGITDTDDANPVYYPLDGTLSFFCYAPYRNDVSSASDIFIDYTPDEAVTSRLQDYMTGSPLICFTPKQMAASQIDFMVSTPIIDVDRNSGAIPLLFTEHLTTNMQFWAKYEGTLDTYESVIISQIVIRNVIGSEYLYFTESGGVFGKHWCNTISPVDGSSTMPLTSYTLSINTGELIESYTLDTSAYTFINESIRGSMYVLPQVINSDTFMDITYVVKSSGVAVDENTISLPLTGTADWPKGKTVRYYLTVKVADRKNVDITVSIEDWLSAGNPHSDEEIMY